MAADARLIPVLDGRGCDRRLGAHTSREGGVPPRPGDMEEGEELAFLDPLEVGAVVCPVACCDGRPRYAEHIPSRSELAGGLELFEAVWFPDDQRSPGT